MCSFISKIRPRVLSQTGCTLMGTFNTLMMSLVILLTTALPQWFSFFFFFAYDSKGSFKNVGMGTRETNCDTIMQKFPFFPFSKCS